MVCRFTFQRNTCIVNRYCYFIREMTREEREALSQRICNFYDDSAKKSVKSRVNYLTRLDIPQCTIYYVLKKVFSIWNHQGSVTKWSPTQIIQEE